MRIAKRFTYIARFELIQQSVGRISTLFVPELFTYAHSPHITIRETTLRSYRDDRFLRRVSSQPLRKSPSRNAESRLLKGWWRRLYTRVCIAIMSFTCVCLVWRLYNDCERRWCSCVADGNVILTIWWIEIGRVGDKATHTHTNTQDVLSSFPMGVGCVRIKHNIYTQSEFTKEKDWPERYRNLENNNWWLFIGISHLFAYRKDALVRKDA